MLNKPHFYNKTIRKVVVAFGSLFNDIQLIRYTKSGAEKERQIVPMSYGPKEKYISRITSDPNLIKSIAINLPRMSFNLDGLSYDISRKQISTLQNFSYTTAEGLKTQYTPIPYNFDFSMSIYVRNTEDGTQILEQILPFFTPDFTVTVDFITGMNQKYDMPIILNSVNSSVDYEGDMFTIRTIVWDLTFTAKGYMWPAVVSGGGLIGAYSANANTYGAAIANITQQANTNTYVSSIEVQSDPLSANPDDEFGFSETIREFPDTL